MIEFFSPGKNHLNNFKENALSMVTFFLNYWSSLHIIITYCKEVCIDSRDDQKGDKN